MPARVVGGERHDGNALTVGGGQVALVEDDDADGTRGRGVLGLDLERAGTSLQQGDVPGREAGEVGRLAPAGRGVAEAEHEVDRRDVGGDVTGIALGDDTEVDVST